MSSPVAPSQRASTLAWIALVAIGAAAVLAFWVFPALPFQDLPAHAGFIALRARIARSGGFEARFFVVAARVGPYSLFHWLGAAFAAAIGPVGAVRALATLPVIATPLALLFARRRLYGDAHPAVGHLGLVLSFGYMTVLGFASYLLGVALLLVELTLWLQLMASVDAREPAAWRRELAVVIVAPIVVVAHGHAFLLFLVLAGVCAVAAGARGRRIVRLRALTPAVALAVYMVLRDRVSPVAGAAAIAAVDMHPRFQTPLAKLGLLFTSTLMTRTGIDVAIGIALWFLVGAGVVATVRAHKAGARTAGPQAAGHRRALLAGMVAVALLFAVLPNSVGWFAFVDGRLVPLLPLLGLLTVDPALFGPRLRVAWNRASAPLAAGIVSLCLVASYLFQNEAAGYPEVLRSVPAEKRLLNLPLQPNSAVFAGHPFVHTDKLALVDKPTVVSDVWFHPGSAIYPTRDNPALRLPPTYSESNLKFIDWPAYRLEDWDYVLIRTSPDAGAPLVPGALRLVIHRGGWWLYGTTPSD